MFECNFATDNDAFANGDMVAETARILRAIAVAVERGGLAAKCSGNVMDANGNRVGRWYLDTEE